MNPTPMTAVQAARLEEQGDHAAAEQAYRQLLAADPANVELLTGHTVACYGLRDYEQAAAHANEDFIEDPRAGRHFHPGVTLAVHDVLGRVSAFSGFWAVRREADRFTDVSFASARGIVPPHWPDELIARMREYFAGSSEPGRLLD